MKFLSAIKASTLAALQWLGAAAHRRALSAIFAAILLQGFGWTIDSALIDNILYVVAFPLLAAWSHHTPEIEPTS